MKIAFFTDTFYPQINGVATSVANFATELGRRGHTVEVYAPVPYKIPGKPFRAKNVRVVYRVSIPSLVYPDFRLGLPKSLINVRKFNPDIIHFHTGLSMGVDAWLCAKLLAKPLVGTNHVYIAKGDAKALCVLPVMQRFERQIASVAIRHINLFYGACDVRFAPSKTLIKKLGEVCTCGPFEYLPNGIPLPKRRVLTETQKRSLRKKYGLGPQTVLHFGRLSKEKSVNEVLRSFAIVHRSHPEATLLVIGDGPEKASLTALAKKLGIHKHTVFTGAIPHEQLMASGLIEISDMLATASTMENHPMVVLEAMSHGLPIVAVKEAGMVDVVSDNGFLVPAGDHAAMAKRISALLEDAELRKTMSKRSLELVKETSIARVTDRLLEFYKDLAATAKTKK
jgi:1,2-diacylglycerol 3-alpha-glucosyltransferase